MFTESEVIMIKDDLRNSIVSLMLAESKKDLIKRLYARFMVILLSDIKISDYEKISESLYEIERFVNEE